MSATLTITDNADGTGGVATIAGSPGGSVNTLYRTPVAGGAWVASGSRVADGTIAAGVPVGFYFWYVDTLSGGSDSISNVVTQGITNAGPAGQGVHYRCLLATQAIVQSLNLMPSGSVVVRLLPRFWEGVETLPLTAIVPYGREADVGELTGKDDIDYPVVVARIDRQNADNQANLAAGLNWRQGIFRAFRRQKLAGVTEIITATVTPDYVVNPELLQKNLWYSAFLINYRSREVRGPGQ